LSIFSSNNTPFFSRAAAADNSRALQPAVLGQRIHSRAAAKESRGELTPLSTRKFVMLQFPSFRSFLKEDGVCFAFKLDSLSQMPAKISISKRKNIVGEPWFSSANSRISLP
jgi:hypothetical protein